MSGHHGTSRKVVAAAAVLISAAAAHGQELLKPIEQGVADVDPLSVSLRDLSVDLRQPIGFEQVYRVPGRPDLLMRADGGLYAVFPQSTYMESEAGAVPLVPAGTVFYLGRPQVSPLAWGGGLASVPEDRTGLRVRSRVSMTPIEEGGAQRREQGVLAMPEPRAPRRDVGPVPTAEGPAIVTDSAYRAVRVRELMRRAATASR